MAVDLLYVAFNRREFTEQTFRALIDNTDWAQVARLFVWDDGSTDGTWEYLCDTIPQVPVPVERRLGPGVQRGPVAAMNWYLDNVSEVDCDWWDHGPDCWRCGGTGRAQIEMFAKLDNDMVVPPGWLTEMLAVTTANPMLDILGMEPMLGPPVFGTAERGFEDATHIGGKGLIRVRAFEQCRPTPGGLNGYFGFTEWQRSHPAITKGWIRPELCCFGLDQLAFEPWASMTAEHEALGWARRWPAYPEESHLYWDWWLEQDPSRRPADA